MPSIAGSEGLGVLAFLEDNDQFVANGGFGAARLWCGDGFGGVWRE